MTTLAAEQALEQPVASPEPSPGTWTLDPAHTSLEFVARHMVVSKVRGRFNEFQGAIHVGEDPAGTWAEATIQAASIDSRSADRDGHLRSPDFLDVDRFPEIRFRTASLERLDGRRWRAVGELTIRDVTRPIALEVEFNGTAKSPWGQEVASFSASAEIDREDFGMTWNQALETGGLLVSRKVRLEIEGEAIRS